jgi:outer membrane lipoprotein SlyB
MRHVFRLLPALALVGLLPVAACAPSRTGESFNAAQMNRTAVSTQGTVIGMREVAIQGGSGPGTAIGAVTGGVAGSFIGGDWRSNLLAGLGGAIIGGIIGNQAERAISSGTATEFTIREATGNDITVVQTNEDGIRIGDRVRVNRSDKTRVVRDFTQG